jgi:hypothetical protein
VIKVGLNPVIIDLMGKGVIQGIAMNGAGTIHDVELAYFGQTSEEVSDSLDEGLFGMAQETGDLINQTTHHAYEKKWGLGEAIGERILREKPEYYNISLLAHAYQLDIPVTVHVALGTDIVHQHPSANGAAIGEVSLRDFRIWAELVSRLNEGGVLLLFGSSVILPEVFLKALTVARNVKGRVNHFTTANFDMLQHYRPTMNVIQRPTQKGGKGYQFTGHHEIMIPLLAAAIKHHLFSD